jgi:hypothetical protein
MPDFSKASKGDRVYSDLHGPGEIVSIRHERGILDIEFSHYGTRIYGFDGCYLETAQRYNPVLHWGQPIIEEPPPPRRRISQKMWFNCYHIDNRFFTSDLYTTPDGARKDASSNDYIGTYYVLLDYEEK